MSTGARLKELRKEAKKKQEEIGKIIGVSQRAIANYENDDRLPSYDYLEKLAQYFNVTTDYLLELTDVRMNNLKDEYLEIANNLEKEYLEIAKELQDKKIPIEKIRSFIDILF